MDSGPAASACTSAISEYTALRPSESARTTITSTRSQVLFSVRVCTTYMVSLRRIHRRRRSAPGAAGLSEFLDAA